MSTPGSTEHHEAFRSALLGWGRSSLRDLPWRRTRDPWAVLVSETMLQQTQVARVEPRWSAFMARWPTPSACAAAPRGEVLRAWEGLGYNRRAVALHEAAAAIVAEHGGVVPDDLGGLLALPGVGPYTARAVLAFAFERDVAVVDVNAGRVLARAVAGARLTARQAQALADELAPAGEGWLWNQAMLELGATACTKRRPGCERCPVAAVCAWGQRGDDPAEGSAATTTQQSRFEGSDRQGRGRLVDALRRGPVPVVEVDAVTGWGDPERTGRVVAGLVADGLAAQDGDHLTLPGVPRR